MKLKKDQVAVIMARKQLSVEEVCLKGNLLQNTFKQAMGNRYKKINPITAGKIAVGLGVDVTKIIETGDVGKIVESDDVKTTNVAERLKFFRIQAGLTQKELGEKAGTSEINIRQYEAGKYTPKPETGKRIADALGVSISDLYGWEERSAPIEKKSGEWINYCCSVCGVSKYNFFTVVHPDSKPFGTWKYCPNCGSEMEVMK